MNASWVRFVVRWIVAASLFSAYCGGSAMAAPFTPLPLTTGANSGFSDEEPEDRRGGWLDLGSNDLRALSAGKLFASGVPFEILDETATGGKSCIVLGGEKRPYLPSSAKVAVEEKQGDFLYLLHGAAWCPPAFAKKMTGVLTVEYAGGNSSEFHVRCGRDVGDWARPESFSNAARAWTAYNANTQVSLFLSRFPLKKQPVKALRFEAKDSAWMIVAATLGDETRLTPIRPDLTLDQEYIAPSLTEPLPEIGESTSPKNIILIIGDGMGPGAIKLTSLYQHKAEGRLVMEQLPVASLCTTFSANMPVTDSAASGTAIATGHKTNNGMLGVNPDEKRLTSVAEAAHKEGRAVGIITSDAITGATPGAFYAHVNSRGLYADIAKCASDSGYEILIGNANGYGWFLPKDAADGKRKDSQNVLEEMTAAGYVVIDNPEKFAQAPQDRRVLGFMAKGTLDSERCLGQLTENAISRLSRNDKGFFLMVECAITDGGGHGNKPELSVRGTLQVDWAVKQAVEFARKNRDTLVLVTADHETGGLSAIMSRSAGNRLTIHYATTSHTGAPVHLYAFGPGASLFSGVIDNTDIGKTIAHLWKLRLPQPRKVEQPEKQRLEPAVAP
jgi:alkaline phosphatase